MQPAPDIVSMPSELVGRLAPGGVLRAGINLSNFLLVTGRAPNGDPTGVAPDMAKAIAGALGVALRYVPYDNPGLLADAAARDEWDICLIGAEPQRAETIAFTPAYAEIEATYLVAAGSPLVDIAEVDTPGVRIAVADRTAYGLWLDRNITRAELVRSQSLDASLQDFIDHKLDVLAGLRPRLLSDQARLPGSRLLAGRFMAVQQAVGVPRASAEAVAHLSRFVKAARASGFVAGLIRKHGVECLSVAAA